MTAILTQGRDDEVDGLDMFSGFGGSSDGIKRAGVSVRLAVNHDELSIECHSANHPEADHLQADLADPDDPYVVNRRGKKVPGRYTDPVDLPAARFVWASPSCKFHSPANALKLYAQGPQATLPGFDDDEFDHVAYANSERSRVTMVCPLRYAARHRPQVVVVENVPEAAHWGPRRAGSTTGDGSTFRWWLEEWRKLGYDTRCLFLNSMFFPPCPQSRDRMYVVCWIKGNRAPDLDHRPDAFCTSDRCGGQMVKAVQTWKRPTKAWPVTPWGKYGAQYTYTCPACRERVDPVAWPAYTAIDWSRLGPSLGERDGLGMKPLAPATVERIRLGLAKFRGGPPIIVPAKSTWGVDRTVFAPMTTQTTQQDKGLVTDGVVIPVHGNVFERPGQTRARALAQPLYTQHGTLAFGFAHTPFVSTLRGGGSKYTPRPVTDAVSAITAEGFHHALVSPALFQKFNGLPHQTVAHPLCDPILTVTGRDTTGLVILPWVDQWRSNPAAVTEQLATVMTHIRHSLASVAADLEPVDDAALAHVRFRMLDPDPELRRGMAFRDDYILLGSKTQMTSGLGNAVTPPVSVWITEQCVMSLRGSVVAA